MYDHVREHLLKTFPKIEFEDKEFDCKTAIEKAEKGTDPYCVCGVFLALFYSLFSGKEYEIADEYYGDLFVDAYNYCLLIKDLVPEAYPFYMGHMLLHMPDVDVLDTSKMEGVELNFNKRIKQSLELLEKAKESGADVDDDIKFAKELIEFTDHKSNSLRGSTYHSSSSRKGCYIATCVYGSYDCPEVWCLRRYRDNYLEHHWWGRAFIKVYYFISPKLVSAFGENKWFIKCWKAYLNRKLKLLKSKGYVCDPYTD